MSLEVDGPSVLRLLKLVLVLFKVEGGQLNVSGMSGTRWGKTLHLICEDSDGIFACGTCICLTFNVRLVLDFTLLFFSILGVFDDF